MHAILHQFGLWLAPSGLNAWARGMANAYVWLIPILQGVHILAACVIVGAAGGLGWRIARGDERSSLRNAAAMLLPWMWGALAVQIATGIFMVVHRPTRAFDSLMFPYKMILLASGAGLAILIAQRLRAERDVRWLGALSLFVWISVVLAGRLISYVKAV